jgi:hypothetical protein
VAGFPAESDELVRNIGKVLTASLRPAILDRDGAILDPAELAQPLRKAAVHGLQVAAEVLPRNPIVGSFPSCCARAASGHAAAAPPSSVMKPRRFN